MILNNTDTRTRESNLGGETIQMGIHDIRIIIDRLTDLYSDRELACIREYSTNALDAHIEAGVKAPIRVSTPTALSPFLTIQDFGVGLSLEDIRVIYSQYGASTKRDTNEQTGALGLGCKSALSYADQFTVTSVKDGVRIQVVVSRDPKKGATMQVVDTSDTPDPNGTTVIIPAKAHNDFERKAKRFFSYWRKGTVVLNGTEPEFMPDARWVTDSLAIVQGNAGEGNRVVMGGVSYPVTANFNLPYGRYVVAFVPIGAVDFAPSREALMDTDTTTATLNAIKQNFSAALRDAIRKDVEQASSHADAALRRLDWLQKVNNRYMPADLTYKRERIPDMLPVPVGTIHAPMNGGKMTSHTQTYEGYSSIPIQTCNEALWIKNFDQATFTATTKKKLVKYCTDNDLHVRSFVLLPALLSALKPLPDMRWVRPAKIVDWPTIKAIKLPRNAPASTTGRIPGSYDVWEGENLNKGVPGDDIDTTNPVFWILGGRYAGSKEAEHLNKAHPGCSLVVLRKGREEKFKRLFPSARNADEVILEDFEAWKKGIDKDVAAAYATKQVHALSQISALDPNKVDDPDIKRLLTTMHISTAALEKEIVLWRRLGHNYEPKISTANPLRKYVLMPDSYYLRRYMRDPEKAAAIYGYLNDAYQRSLGKCPTWKECP